MTQEQIQEQIAKFEKGLTNPNIPESAKETIKKKIEDLKSQIQKVEEVIEKKEEKISFDLRPLVNILIQYTFYQRLPTYEIL